MVKAVVKAVVKAFDRLAPPAAVRLRQGLHRLRQNKANEQSRVDHVELPPGPTALSFARGKAKNNGVPLAAATSNQNYFV